MAIPTYDKLMLPLLQFASDGHEHAHKEAMDALAEAFQLTDEDKIQHLSGGMQTVFENRFYWAKIRLVNAGLLENIAKRIFRITEFGFEILQKNPPYIDMNFLRQFSNNPNTKPVEDDINNEITIEHTPAELIESIYQQLRSDLAENLLEYVLASSPSFFERLVVDLLLAMGYGGALENAGQTIGRSGDGGIDGYIQEDKLGLDVIYIQAKRWERDNTVGRPVVQAFVGSLMGAGASKGVLMTTSRFSQEATQYARGMQNLKVILIDGQQLAQLMIEHSVGVSVEKTYVIKKIDENYFPDMS